MKSKDLIHKILETTKDSRDAQTFLDEFRKQNLVFACLFVSLDTLQENFYSIFHQTLQLKELGIFPLLVLPRSARKSLRVYFEFEKQFHKEIERFPFYFIRNETDLSVKIEKAKSVPKIPIFLSKVSENSSLILNLSKIISISKFLFLDSRGPIVDLSNGKILPFLSPGRELEALKKSHPLYEDFFRLVNLLLEGEGKHLHLVITFPDQLFTELFTIKGSGTLARRRSKIHSYRLLSEVEMERLKELMETSFQKKLRNHFWDRPFDKLLLEENYQGCVWLEKTETGTILSKFAVTAKARGLGIGRDLWEELCESTESFFWRSKPNNSINPWYMKMADGYQRTTDWLLFWRGISKEKIPKIIDTLISRSEDFESF